MHACSASSPRWRPLCSVHSRCKCPDLPSHGWSSSLTGAVLFGIEYADWPATELDSLHNRPWPVHRNFMAKMVSDQQGWAPFHRLLIALLRFLEPYLRNAELTDSVRLLYKGTLRVLLVLLHDFPEFLCEYHFEVGPGLA